MGLGSFFKRNKKTDIRAEEENIISIGRIISHTFTLYDNIFYCF